jgi:hypothetical protein
MTAPAYLRRPIRAHAFQRDPDIPPDHNDRSYCRLCHLPGQPGDARHPDDQGARSELTARILGERD